MAKPETTGRTTRTFLALGVSAEARRALGRIRASLARALPAVRFADLAGVHLTLTFLGSLDAEQLALATEGAEASAHASSPFDLTLGRPGFFGPAHAPRVLWVGVDGQIDPLRTLQRRLADELAARAASHVRAALSPPTSPLPASITHFPQKSKHACKPLWLRWRSFPHPMLPGASKRST